MGSDTSRLIPLNIRFSDEGLIPWHPPVVYIDNGVVEGRLVGLSLKVKDRKGVLLKISRVFYEEDVDIRHLTVLRSPEGGETRIYVIWRCTGKKLPRILERLKSLDVVEQATLIEPASTRLWVNTEAGPSILDPQTKSELIILRKQMYRDTIRALFDKTGSILIIPYFHQMFNYGRQVARWYLAQMKGASSEEVLCAAATIYRALGLGSMKWIRTRDECYEVAVEKPYDPVGYCCPGTRGIVSGFLSELNGFLLRTESKCREEDDTCVFRVCRIY